jgi:gliding motility-associated-like protein
MFGDTMYTYYPNTDYMGRDSMTYTLVTPCGNTGSAYIFILTEELKVPEIISPNGDGKNDVLIIDGIHYFPGNMLQIFNRLGHVVYEQRDYNNDWGGYSNRGALFGNKPLPAGTYYYTLIYNEGKNRQAGFIYLLW